MKHLSSPAFITKTQLAVMAYGTKSNSNLKKANRLLDCLSDILEERPVKTYSDKWRKKLVRPKKIYILDKTRLQSHTQKRSFPALWELYQNFLDFKEEVILDSLEIGPTYSNPEYNTVAKWGELLKYFLEYLDFRNKHEGYPNISFEAYLYKKNQQNPRSKYCYNNPEILNMFVLPSEDYISREDYRNFLKKVMKIFSSSLDILDEKPESHDTSIMAYRLSNTKIFQIFERHHRDSSIRDELSFKISLKDWLVDTAVSWHKYSCLDPQQFTIKSLEYAHLDYGFDGNDLSGDLNSERNQECFLKEIGVTNKNFSRKYARPGNIKES